MESKHSLLFKTLVVVLVPFAILGAGLPLCFRQRGFSVDKIASNLEYKEAWELESMPQREQENLVHEVFSQPFYYLDAGQQCYAFVSEDQKYVLKFFKMHHLLPKMWLNHFPFSLFESYRFNHVEKKQQFLEETFNSLKSAYDCLRNETGLLYIHLNKSRCLKQKVDVIGRRGERYSIDLDSKEFVLQRKADPLFPHLLGLIEKGEDQRVHQCIRSLLQTVVVRCRSKFADQGIGIRYNYGFIDDQAVIIDCGQFVPDESLIYPHNYQREILRVTSAVDQWAQHHCPDLVPIVQQEAQQWINAIQLPVPPPVEAPDSES
jgi:hypothetical protein